MPLHGHGPNPLSKNIFNLIDNPPVVMAVGFGLEVGKVFEQPALLSREIRWCDDVHCYVKIPASAPAKHRHSLPFEPEHATALRALGDVQALFAFKSPHTHVGAERGLSE